MSNSGFNDHLKIDYSLKARGMLDFIILRRDGKLVKSEKINATEGFSSYSFEDLSSLPVGIYFVILKPENGEAISRKIINF